MDIIAYKVLLQQIVVKVLLTLKANLIRVAIKIGVDCSLVREILPNRDSDDYYINHMLILINFKIKLRKS